jgi:arylsulfatase
MAGGHSWYARGGKPKYCYNFYGLERTYVEGTAQIPPGTHQVRLEFAYDGGGLGQGGTMTLFIDGNAVGDGRITRTQPSLFSADETCDVGTEFGSPVTPDYQQRPFSGAVNWVTLDLVDAQPHLLAPEDLIKEALAIQ